MFNVRYLTPAHDVLSYEAEDGRIVIVDAGRPGWSEAVAAGPAAYVQPEPPPPTIDDYRTAVQSHLDAAAQSRLYTDGNSLATYAASTNPTWAAEARAFVAWRDAVWAQVYGMWASLPDPVPSPADVVAGLPVIEWPEVGE